MYRVLRFLVRLGWPMRLLGPLFGHLNLFHPTFRVDPHPAFRNLRERAPIYRHPVLRVWFLSRYEDCAAVLKDPSFSVDRSRTWIARSLFRSLRPDFVEGIRRSLIMLDPPDHTRVRGLVNKAFTPRVVEGLRPRIQGIVDDLLDEAEAMDDFDLVRDFAYPLPVTVIAEMLGVPAADRERFRSWSVAVSGLLDPFHAPGGLAAADAAYAELEIYFRDVFEARRREPRDDLISALVAAREDGVALSEVDLQSVAGLILGAGYETTANLIANAVLALLRHPGERKRLIDDPSLIDSAVEEFLRYEGPLQSTDRVATRDCEVGGQRIRKGEVVVTLLAAANRDPARFPEPDRLDVGRPENHHLAFGQGIHFCLGAQLARAETAIGLATLLRRFPDFEGQTEPLAWRPSFVLRGPLSLPLALAPRRSV